MRLEDLLGQQRAVSVLRNALRRDRIAHAYLFSGPESVGKSTAARLYAQALNCEASGGAIPCDACQSCRWIREGNHPDVRVIGIDRDASGRRRREISIDQIRQNPRKPRQTPPPLIQDAYLKPAFGKHKVYLVDPADRMTAEAGNALLKMLEEPPPRVVVILVTSEPSTLLPTVLSRCQEVVFQLSGSAEIEQHLLGLEVEPQTAASLARLSGGRIAWAIRAARRPDILKVRRTLLDLCHAMSVESLPAAPRIAEAVKQQAAQLAQRRAADGEGGETEDEEGGAQNAPYGGDRALREELPWCLEIMVSWYRDLLSICQDGPLLNPDYEAALRQRCRPQLLSQAESAVEIILEAKQAIERNANIDLALESLAIGLVGRRD